jgi:hypothetical protein
MKLAYRDWLDAVCIELRALGKDASDLGLYTVNNPEYWKRLYLSGAGPDRAAMIAELPSRA